MRRAISVHLEGPRVTVDRFVQAVQGLLAVVNEVDRELGGHGKSVRFVITGLSRNSAHLSAAAEPIDTAGAEALLGQILDISARGIASLATSPTRPQFFTDKAVQAVSSIARVVQPGFVSSVALSFDDERVPVPFAVVANAQHLLGEALRSLGSIEGHLEIINVHGRSRCVIYDAITHRPVNCFFPEEDLPFVVGAFGRRVAAYGTVWANPEGDPVSVQLKSGGDLVVFSRDEDLPSARDVRGLLSAG
jgi:hypothetical protein